MKQQIAKFTLGDIVKHRHFPFRGVIFDVDSEFSNTEDWYEAIPAAARPRKDQPFYHLYAVNPDTSYVAYVSEQNLLSDAENGPVEHPMLHSEFAGFDGTRYRIRSEQRQ